MDSVKAEHDSVVKHLAERFGSKYNVLSNLEKEQHFVAGIFPDLILMDKATNKPMFIIEVKRNGGIATCLHQWKNVKGGVPATLYIVLPETDLKNAQEVSRVIGMLPRFGTYKTDSTGIVTVNFT